LPILFKTYAGGRFTDKLVSSFTHKEEVKLKISESKGEGLQFTHLNPGKIIMLAGGTGIYPFSDFIDLLFKSELKRARIDLQR
jgi:NAD(P)H-flavin reductase